MSAWKSAMRLMTGIASHDPFLPQPGDVAGAIAELAENRVAVLAGVGAGGDKAARRAAQRHRLADQLDLAELFVMDLLRDAEMLDLRVGKDLVHPVDRARRHPRLVEPL